MMKRVVSLVLAVIMILSVSVAAMAETSLVNQKERKIKIQLSKDGNGNYPTNPVIDGESPTTGLEWDGYYMPMLVQIDNASGGTGVMSPWGARFADIVYETPLHKNGDTRISFLFSDTIPESAGPVRSARIGHVRLRAEWDAGFLYYGGSEAKSVSIKDEFKRLKTDNSVLFSGIVGSGKPWKQYYTRVKGKKGPHNVDANVLAMQALIPDTHVAPDRPFLFTDDLPEEGDFASLITLKWPHKNYVSTFEYDDSTNVYLRSVAGAPYVDDQTGERLAFSNVIIQRTKLAFKGADKPVTDNVGSGNAEIFIGGRYIAGSWVRTGDYERTIYFDADGNELQLQRGTTFIAMMPEEYEVTYE